MSANLLLTNPEYKTTETGKGIWREYLYQDGMCFREYRSHKTLLGMPLVTIANGRNPETGKMAVAEGFIAIGQRANGVVAIGQMAKGTVAIGQLARGSFAAIGQLAIGPIAVGQGAVGILAVGQIGLAAIGAFMFGASLQGVNLASFF